VIDGGADVICGGLAGFDVECGGFEEDVGSGGFQPGSDGRRLCIRFPAFVGQECPTHTVWIQAIGVGNPSQAAGCDSGDVEGDSVAVAEFGLAVFEETGEGAVDIAEAEEAEVVGADTGFLARGLKPQLN
jgi:hypothetical protein